VCRPPRFLTGVAFEKFGPPGMSPGMLVAKGCRFDITRHCPAADFFDVSVTPGSPQIAIHIASWLPEARKVAQKYSGGIPDWQFREGLLFWISSEALQSSQAGWLKAGWLLVPDWEWTPKHNFS